MKIRILALGLAMACMSSLDAEEALPGDVELIRDVTYGTGSGHDLKLDVLRPKSHRDGAGPAVVYIHGGSWANGSKSKLKKAEVRLAQHGYVVATIDYRFSQEAIFPAQLEDSKCAVRWLRAHAGDYQVDPQRIGVWGDSAGGHLAALVGTAQGLEGQGGWPETSSRVRAVVDMYGPSDFTPTSLALLAKAPPELKLPSPDDPNSSVAKLLGGPITKVPEQAREASPTTHVTPDDPPFLLLHGDHDTMVPLQQSQLLAETLKKSGVEANLVIYKGGSHGLAGFEDEYYPQVERFLDRHLGKPDRKSVV